MCVNRGKGEGNKIKTRFFLTPARSEEGLNPVERAEVRAQITDGWVSTSEYLMS